jgi:CHAT domain-containing protein/tetratricopeptide (TPR) repeat protein
MTNADVNDLGPSREELEEAEASLAAVDRNADPAGWASLSARYGHALQAMGVAHFPKALQAYRDALTVFHRLDFPAEWYEASLMLAFVIVQDWPVDIPNWSALQEAAAILDELSADSATRAAEVHAGVLGLRAKALTQLTEHDPARFDAACEAQRVAAGEAQRVASGKEQSVVMMMHIFADANLALAELLVGHDGDMDEAISALENAISFYQADKHPGEWVRSHWYLARLLESRIESCPELLAACAHLEAVVSIKPPLLGEAFYAKACNDLALWLSDGRCVVDRQRLDRAISWSEESLKYWPEDDLVHRMDHAAALAGGYQTRAVTSHDNADLIRAVALLDEAADLARLCGAPVERMIPLVHDSAQISTMITTGRRQNLEIAIERLTELLHHFANDMSPTTLATVHQTLGTIYGDRIAGSRAENLDLGKENLETALEVLDRQANPDQWASVANNLSNVYWKRVNGDNGENLEKAIALAEAALTIRTREKDPQLWARTVHSLGNLYYQRPLGDLSNNAEKSIGFSQSALQVETKEAYPVAWAGANRNLGNAYVKRERGDRGANLSNAASCFRNALSVTSALEDRNAHAESLTGLGMALLSLGKDADDQLILGDAVTAYEQAAAIFEEVGSADSQALAHFNLAHALFELQSAESAARALEVMLKCLPAWDADRNPLRAPDAYHALARFSDRLGQSKEAYEWICRAVGANEVLFAGATAEDSKIELVADSTTLYLRAVELALRSGAPASEALLLAERGRTRLLREAVVRLQPDWVIPAELLARESALMAERRRAWEGVPARDSVSGSAGRDFAQVQALTEQLGGLWEQMRSYPGGSEYVAARGGGISWDQIRSWVDTQPRGFALLEYVVMSDRVVAFVVRQGRPEPAMVEIPLDMQQLDRCAQALYREMDGSTGGRVRTETWDGAAGPLVTMVQPELAGARLLCIVPHIMLHHFPLHALGAAGATLLDQMPVYYAHSAGLAARLNQEAPRGGRTDRRRALVVGDSLGDLRYARLEAKRAGQVLGVQPLIGDQATLEAVLAQLPEADIAHFACHGRLRVDDPALSAVVLADAVLSAGQLRRRALRCDLLVLSGCDTGFQPVDRTLEAGGLPSALIAAGARTVVGGLWPVNDKVTAELFALFYRELARGTQPPGGDEIARSVAGCLRAAELALRETRPERYYWSPFIVVGTW